jgi:Na+/glutamate symporter
LASEVNAISKALNESQVADVEDMAVNAATLALIIAHLQGKKAAKKKRKRRTRVK